MLWNLFNILPFFHSTDCFAYMRNILATSVIACFCEVPSTQGMQKAGDVIEFDREHTFKYSNIFIEVTIIGPRANVLSQVFAR